MSISKSLFIYTASIVLMLYFFTSCSLGSLFNGSYLDEAPTPAELGFVPKGENIGAGAVIYTSSSLEDNLGLVNPSKPSEGTWREFAQWAGWLRSNLNDGIVINSETGGDGASSGWSTISASPDENLPAWVIYDFGQIVDIKTIGLYPRTDTPLGPSTNMPQDFSFWTASTLNMPFILADTEDVYDSGVNEMAWTPLLEIYEDATQQVYSDGLVTHTGDSFPAEASEQLYVLNSTRSAQYLILYISKAGGNFVQLNEMAVYGP